jgi:Protein of unknown function (DUF3072)
MMSDRNTRDTGNDTVKDPAEWTTGDEPMTGAQEYATSAYKAFDKRKSGWVKGELKPGK